MPRAALSSTSILAPRLTPPSARQIPTTPKKRWRVKEKAAGLASCFSSRLSVLVGPAGTGKTTLLQTLVAQPEVKQDGVLLLAPTGKARVQLQSKVAFEAQTLASFLVKKGGFDPHTGQYQSVDKSKRLPVRNWS